MYKVSIGLRIKNSTAMFVVLAEVMIVQQSKQKVVSTSISTSMEGMYHTYNVKITVLMIVKHNTYNYKRNNWCTRAEMIFCHLAI